MKHPCGVCDRHEFKILWKLPELPLTECFGPYDPDFRAYDQALMICSYCGHAQLEERLPTEALYSANEYAYRTGKAHGTPKRLNSFINFCNKQLDKKNDLSVIDIGGNDQTLLKSFSDQALNLALIDPIRQEDDGKLINGVNIYGRFVEQMNLIDDIQTPPDLVVCTHTLEHIADPIKLLQQLFEQCPKECLFVFEVPCLDSMVKQLRFDAVFHQHFHYFSLKSLKNLVSQAGGEIIAHDYNDFATLGGSIMIAFRFKNHIVNVEANPLVEGFCALFDANKKKFTDYMSALKQAIDCDKSSLYGFGASLMLPVLLYHLDIKEERFTYVIDDDPLKHGWQYKNLNLLIGHPDKLSIAEGERFMVTSVENTMPILNRIESFNPEFVYAPIASKPVI